MSLYDSVYRRLVNHGFKPKDVSRLLNEPYSRKRRPTLVEYLDCLIDWLDIAHSNLSDSYDIPIFSESKYHVARCAYLDLLSPTYEEYMHLRILYVDSITAILNGSYVHDLGTTLPVEELLAYRARRNEDHKTKQCSNGTTSRCSSAGPILKYMYIKTVAAFNGDTYWVEENFPQVV